MASALEIFQSEHGRAWGELVGGAAFAAAMVLTNSEKIQSIASLSDDEIAAHGVIILSDLRGHLKAENALLGLHEKKEFVFQELGPEDYVSPEEEAAELERQRNQQQQQESGSPRIVRPVKPPVKRKPQPKKKK